MTRGRPGDEPPAPPGSATAATPTAASRPAAESHPVGGSRVLRWLIPAIVVAAVAGVIGLFAYGLITASKGSTLVSEITAGARPAAPRFQLSVLWPSRRGTLSVQGAVRGGVLDLARLRGKPVVLNFWASWCVACRAEAKLLANEARLNPSVVFVGVDVQDLRGEAVAFLRRYQVPYTAVADHDNSTYDAYGLTGVPETYYLSRRGRIVAHDAGPVTFSSLTAGIQEAQG